MTDPNDITQTSAVVESAGGPGGIVGAVLGAMTVLGGLWRIVFGTRKERQDANERAAEIALRAAEHADERAEFEIADVVETARDSGIWLAPGYTPDGVHDTNTANLAIQASGNINPAVFVR